MPQLANLCCSARNWPIARLWPSPRDPQWERNATLPSDRPKTLAARRARSWAYTGAATARAGLLKAADGGLLFLDEIGELGTDEQAMLLRAVEERRFLPVGSDTETCSDFQLIAGTNRDLPAIQVAVRSGAKAVRRFEVIENPAQRC